MFSKKYTIFVLFVFLLFIWSFTVVCAENTENTTVTDVDSELISVNMEINSSNEQLNDDFLQSNFNINNVSTIDTSNYTHVFVSPNGNGSGVSANDSTNFTQAIANLQNYTIIHVTDGDYKVFFNIDKSNVIIQAEHIGKANLMNIQYKNKGNEVFKTINIYGNHVTISGLNFKDNYLSLKWFGFNGSLSYCNFINQLNRAGYLNGGVVYWAGANGSINNCNFTDNQRNKFPGVMWINGGVVYWAGANGSINNCNFNDNKAFYNQAWMNGGVVYWAGANGVINNSNFTNNTSIKNGSAIYWNAMNGSVNNCYFTVKETGKYYVIYNKNQLSLYNNTIESKYAIYNMGIINSLVTVTISDNKTINCNLYDYNVLINASLVDDNHNIILGGNLVFDVNNFITLKPTLDDNKYIYKYIPFVEGLTTISANYGNASKVYVKTANLQVNPLPRVIHNIPIPNEKYKFNVYVSQDGTGDGVSIDNPTTLINAINNLQEYSIIHIANGFYNYDNLKITKNNVILQADNIGKSILSGNQFSVFGDNVTCFGFKFINGNAFENNFIQWSGNNGIIVACDFINNINNNSVLYWTGLSGLVEDCIFLNNTVSTNTTSENSNVVYWAGNNGTLKHSIFKYNNGTTGAVYWIGDNGNINYCNFTFNLASYKGGAILWEGINGILSNSLFLDNYVKYSDDSCGGAVYWSGVKGVIKYCNFTGNTANGINSCGGAVYWSGIDGICIDSNFVNGNASKGGSIYWDGNNGSIDNCSFKNNQAYLGLIYEYHEDESYNTEITIKTVPTYGAAIYWAGDNGSVKRCDFVNNTAIENAGAIFWMGSFGLVEDCIFINNIAKTSSRNWDSNNGFGGGAIYWMGINGTILYSDFKENRCADGKLFNQGGALIWRGDNGNVSYCNFTKNSAKGKAGAIYWLGNNGVLFQSNIIDNYAFDFTGGGAIYWEGDGGNISHCNFTENTGLGSNMGGSVLWNGANGNLEYCNFINASMSGYGVFLSWLGANGTLKSSNFINANTGFTGGAVYWKSDFGFIYDCNFVNNTSSNIGGAICIDSKNTTVANCNFTNNLANLNQGNAIEVRAFGANITGCIFKNNGKGIAITIKNSKYSSINNCIFFDDSHLEKIIHIDYSRLCDLTNCKFVLPDGFDVDSIIFYEEATLKKRGNSYISISDWNKPIVPIPDSSGGKIVIPGEDVPDSSGGKIVIPGEDVPDSSGGKIVIPGEDVPSLDVSEDVFVINGQDIHVNPFIPGKSEDSNNQGDSKFNGGSGVNDTFDFNNNESIKNIVSDVSDIIYSGTGNNQLVNISVGVTSSISSSAKDSGSVSNSGDNSKSYEINKNAAKDTTSNINLFYGIIFVVICVFLLFIIGYRKQKKQ